MAVTLRSVLITQTGCKKYWRNLNMAVTFHSVLHKHCEYIYQGALPSSCLRYLSKALSLQLYKKYDWQHASAELAICTAHVEGCRAGLRALLHALRAKIILADLFWRFQPQLPNRQI